MRRHDRRHVLRDELSPEDYTFAALFEGLRGLNGRYERAVRWITAAVMVGIMISAAEGGLLWYSFVQRSHDRIAIRHALEHGTRSVALFSCVRQNEHRKVEREILTRSLRGASRLKVLLPAAEIRREQRELRHDIHLLGAIDCRRVVALIPTR